MVDPRPVLFDVNALVALSLTTHQHHGAAHAYLTTLHHSWATCPLTEASLYRLLLNPAVTGSQRRASDVTAILRGMRADHRWVYLSDSSRLCEPRVDVAVLMGHQQVTDLHLVNLAASHGGVLATFDAAIPTWLAPDDRQHVVVLPA